MANGDDKVFNIAIKPTDGVRIGMIKGWVRVLVKIGKKALEIWDDRKKVKDAFLAWNAACDDVLASKRKKTTQTEGAARMKRDSLLDKIWEAFQGPAEVETEEKAAGGGEYSIQYLSFFDTNVKQPEKTLRICRTNGRWVRDPMHSIIKPVKGAKGDDRFLHIVCSSNDDPVDVIEKDDDGIVTKSFRFVGQEEPTIRTYTKVKVVEAEKEEQEIEGIKDEKPRPPVAEEKPPIKEEKKKDYPATPKKGGKKGAIKVDI